MKQIVITGHGGHQKLKIQESPDPIPGDAALRIRVKASGINFADIIRSARSDCRAREVIE